MLSNYRVLDLTDEKGHLAGRILADLGADVIKVEPAEGDALRRRGPFLEGPPHADLSLPWIAANPGKRSVVLDLAGSEGDRQLLRRAVASADVLLESFAPGCLAGWGLGYSDLLNALPPSHPGLVFCSITPYGQSGPYASHRAGDLCSVAMGGNAWMTGDPAGSPLRCSLPTSFMHAGPESVVGVLMALWARPMLGAGQHVDISIQECQLATLIRGPGQFALDGRARGRAGHRTGSTREIWRCRDGWVSYGLRGGPARAGSLQATVELMAEHGMAPDWLRAMDWSTYSPADCDEAELTRLEACFGEFFASQSMEELYQEALARRIFLAPCNDASAILEQVQLRSRGFWTTTEYPQVARSLERPAFFARSSRGPLSARIPLAPARDEHGDELRAQWRGAPQMASREPVAAGLRLKVHLAERGCLLGLRVLELGSGAAGPVATGYLAEQGATVIRVESRRRPDFLRLLHVTQANRDQPDVLERAPLFALLNPDKQSLALDMKRSEAKALVRRLILEWADVVVENFATGVMERWGLAYGDLCEERPDLVMVSGSLFGQTGPQRTYPGFGGQGSAIAGFNHMTGLLDREALGPHGTITDSLSPRYVAAGLLAALIHLRRTGEGQHLDVSQIETGVYSLAEMVVRASAGGEVISRMGNRSEDAAPHGIYPCRPAGGGASEESWLAIEVRSDAQWQSLVELMGAPHWAIDPGLATTGGRLEQVEELDSRLRDWTTKQSLWEVIDLLQGVGIAAAAVLNFRGLLEDPQLAQRGHFVELGHPVLGKLAYERSAIRLSENTGGIRAPAPLLGQHTREILSAALGLEDSEIDRLEADGVTI